MEFIQHVVSQLNMLVFVKDLSHRYIYCNDRFAETCGEDSPEACYGKTDENLIWKKYTDLYREGDKKVFQGNTLCNMLEPVVDGCMLVNKQPLISKNGDIKGVICSSMDVSNLIIHQKQPSLILEEKRFNLGEYFGNTILSRREFQVLKKIMLGHTAKEISVMLLLSQKTIENYILRLKVKMQCTTKGEIIYHSVLSGLYQRLYNMFEANHKGR
jgi:DNA-binding CsgD family transcriptional regulator